MPLGLALSSLLKSKMHTDPDNRGFDDAPVGTGGASARIFSIEYPGAIIEPRAVMFFVNRASVSTNSITLPAAVTTCPSSETTENTRATAGGGTCRVYDAGAMTIGFDNYLGTVFNNTDTANRARGLMYCHTDFFF